MTTTTGCGTRGPLRRLGTALRSGDAAAKARDDEAGYVGFRAARDTAAFGRLLTEPTRVLVGRRVSANTRPPISTERALHIAAQVEAIYRSADVKSTLTEDVRALVDTATLLIAWVRDVQLATDSNVLGNEKLMLYRLLFAATLLRQESDAAILDHNWSDPPTSTDAKVAFAASRAYVQWKHNNEATKSAFDPSTNDRAFYATMANLTQGSDSDLMDDLWDVAARLRNAIQNDSQGECDLSPIFGLLAQLDASTFKVQSLHRLFATVGGVPGAAAEVGYHEITGGQNSPLSEWFTTLLSLEARAALGGVLKGRELAQDPRLFTSKSKLAGNTAANFGGFLSKEWRLNDWRWGRLDAAAGLVDVIWANASDQQIVEGAKANGLWTPDLAARGMISPVSGVRLPTR